MFGEATQSRRLGDEQAMTLILFEEVDIVFEEYDKGFFAALLSLMKTTKRPIVLTCNRTPQKSKIPSNISWNLFLEIDSWNLFFERISANHLAAKIFPGNK